MIWKTIIFFKFKMGPKVAETIYNLNNTFAPRIANKQCSAGSRSFAKEMRALKMRSAVASHRRLTVDNWEPSSKLILLKLHRKLTNNSVSTILQSFGIWSKLERWKSSISGCLPINWKLKKSSFWSVTFSYLCNNNEPFLDWIVTCNDKCIFYNSQWSPAK